MRVTNADMIRAIGNMRRLQEDYQQLGWQVRQRHRRDEPNSQTEPRRQTHDNENEALATLRVGSLFFYSCQAFVSLTCCCV